MRPNRFTLLLALALLPASVFSQNKPSEAEQMARSAMARWKDPLHSGVSPFPKWSYDQGVVLKGIEQVWKLTGEKTYFDYIQHSMDYFVTPEGGMPHYSPKGYKLDDINTGKLLLELFRVTGQKKYWKAAGLLRDQLRTQPRTSDGGFWHKTIYPHQMWLDGLYMAEPFYAEYAMLDHEDSAFTDIAHQFILMEDHARDPRTGLLYHGWDESREQSWANKTTGDSPNFWGRAIGWYAMALVDALDYFPAANPYRDSLTGILQRLAAAVAKYQDPATGCWYQVMDKGDSAGNYLESSASCMFVYSIAKGVRKGYLNPRLMKVAEKGYQGILKQFITRDGDGHLSLSGVCAVAGLGGHPYRDGSYHYYVSQRPVSNDPKGVGAFILAASEMDIASMQARGKGLTVTLDNYFNHETRADITGRQIPFHYTWDDMANSGFSLWGDIWRYRGVATHSLATAPDKQNLSTSDVYVIVDPDTRAESPSPHYISPSDAAVLRNWVRKGGILVLLANDSGNCEFTHLNQLSDQFGIHFNGDSKNRVQGHQFEQGALDVPAGSKVFPGIRKVYIKELSTLRITGSANAVLKTRGGDTAAAWTKFGKGVVFAVGDPWFYNEYTDGRKLPAEYQNYQAAVELTDWVIHKAR
jgi:unsaturated rhamnogalacturonyl hydrolase